MRIRSTIRRTLLHSAGLVAGAFGVVVLLNLFLIFKIGSLNSSDANALQPVATAQLDHRMHDCVHNVLDLVGVSRPQISYYDYVWNICAHEIYTFDSYVDFDIRREKIIRKGLDERVLLLMVVTVTLSGVALAAVQLWLSYKLASAGHGDLGQPGTLSVKRGELALQSSVTGLFILAFSLAFFIIYVKWIYPTQEVAVAGLDFKAIPTGNIVGVGQLDPSPPSGPQQPAPSQPSE